MSIKHKFASAIYHSRKGKGLTQEKVAEAVNISTRWFQMIEKGQRLPSTILALKIIAFLEIDGKRLIENEPLMQQVSI